MLTSIAIPVNLKQPIRQQQLHKHDLDAYRQLVGGHLEVITLDRLACTSTRRASFWSFDIRIPEAARRPLIIRLKVANGCATG
jgi:hypothetical protein